MINMKLEVEDYCHNCTEFAATCDQIGAYDVLGKVCNGVHNTVIIRCKYEEHCKNMKEYLSKTKSKEDSEC